MSKFSNLLRLLTLLKSNKRIKRKEIAEILGVSEVMVRKYISDLLEANINIQSIPGPNGGYELKGYDYLINLNIDNDELDAFRLAIKDLKSIGVEYVDRLDTLNDKLVINYERCNNKQSNCVCESNPVYLSEEDDYELKLQSACITRTKIRISYHSISSGYTIRTVRPYAIISRKDMKYLIAYCEEKQSERTFKLVRISGIEVLAEKFDIDSSFDITEYMKDTIGIFNNEDMNLKLLIRKPFSFSVSERKYVENQEIEWNEYDDSIIFTARMRGKQDILKWILSMSEYVTILEPLSLKEEVKEILKNMIDTI